jgi:2-C-methyl-D-erythritol 4-phosphate cytidylyltransferase
VLFACSARVPFGWFAGSVDEQPLGVVPLAGRGSLPFALVHGESLVAAATWALGEAGVEVFDLGTTFEQVRDADRALVVHDPLCPLTPPGFLREAVEECAATGAVVVGVREVTDTVKEYDAPGGAHEAGRLGRTHAREELMTVVSPVVLPATVVASLEEPDVADLAVWVAALSQRYPVRFLPAPALARRVVAADDLVVLEALSRSAVAPEQMDD